VEHQAKLDLRKAEVHLQEKHAMEDLEPRRAEVARLRQCDEQIE